jgi:CRISPR/Cas system-associated endoribonuclease Cas2
VIVFSGDFSWIKQNEDLETEIKRLSSEHKISFVSYKSANVVESAIGSALYTEFHERGQFRFDQNAQLKCSLVKINHSKIFIYKVDREAEGGDKNVCIIPGKDDARYLLETLESLCQQYAP